MDTRNRRRALVRMYGCPARSPVTIMNMTSQNTGPTSNPATLLVLKLAGAIVLGLLAAGVALAYAGWKPEAIGGLLTAIGTVAGALLVVLPKLAGLQEKVDQVAQQTNGALRSHITDTVRTELRRALADQLGQPINPPPPTTPRKRR